MRKWFTLGATIAALAAAPTLAGGFELDWYTIDGGGGTSSGGAFTLSGTIGQPDAGVVMSGGNFTLTGGFWAGVATGGDCAGTVCADSSCDGAVTVSDIAFFVQAVTGGEAGWNAAFPGGVAPCDFLCANDVSGDGNVTVSDIAFFVNAITGGGCP